MIKIKSKKQSKNKKAQEEVFGFVIIVLIVMIIGIVFFAFSLRRSSEIIEPKSNELNDLLQAMLSYTTNCKMNAEDLSIRQLLRECNNYPTRQCENQEIYMCDLVEDEFKLMLKEFLGTESELAQASVHGYVLNITNPEQLIAIENGQFEGNYFLSSIPIPSLSASSEDIIVELTFYYST